MGYFDYKTPVRSSYLDTRNPPYKQRKAALGGMKATGQSFYPGYEGSSFGHSNFNREVYNPQKDRLEEGSIVEDWIPRQPTNLHLMLRRIYLRDAIAGTVVDIFSTLPWGKVYELIGIDDPKVLQMYYDMLEAINIWGELPMICREVQVIGRNIASLSFNETLGYWDGMVPVDPDQARIQPVPLSGHKPLIDVLSSPGWREFARSTDPRIVELKRNLNPSLMQFLVNQGGYVPLDPLNTLWLARRVNQYDHIGTSIFARILPAWAYEMALWNASLTGVRRRNRSILFIQAGIEESWEPTDEEIGSLTSMFMQADEDPTGAVIAVRNGVEVSEVRDPTQIWGISQEFEFLSTIKMRALGVSEAYLSGETNVSNMESARTSLGKSIASFREYVLRELFTKQLFPTFARIHNMRRRTQAELAHNIRTNGHDRAYIPLSCRSRITARDAMSIPVGSLLVPQLVTEDTLRPVEDVAYIDMLKSIKDEGVPVPLRIWASAAGYDLDKALAMMDEDSLLRKRISQVAGEGMGMEGAGEEDMFGEGGGDDFGGGDEEQASPEGGGEEAPMGPGGGAEDFFGSEKAGMRPGQSVTMPPKWPTSAGVLPYQKGKALNPRPFTKEQLDKFWTHLQGTPTMQAMSKIEPRVLAELQIPNSRALVPYDE